MKVLLCGARRLMNVWFADALSATGWEVHSFDDEATYLESPWARHRVAHRILWRFLSKNTQTAFLRAVEHHRPDLIFVVKGWYFSPDTLLKVRDRLSHVRLIHFHPDNPDNTWHFGNSNDWIRDAVPIYDLHLTWGRFLMSRLTQLGAPKVAYWPFAYDPRCHFPTTCSQEDLRLYGSDVSFIGSWDEERESLISKLRRCRLAIWGNGWERSPRALQSMWRGRATKSNEFSKICSASQIVLNIIRRQNESAHNMKSYEIPACKAFMACTRTTEMQELLIEGRGMVSFDGAEELAHTIERYLPDEGQRRIVSQFAYDRIQDETYFKRMQQLTELYRAL